MAYSKVRSHIRRVRTKSGRVKPVLVRRHSRSWPRFKPQTLSNKEITEITESVKNPKKKGVFDKFSDLFDESDYMDGLDPDEIMKEAKADIRRKETIAAQKRMEEASRGKQDKTEPRQIPKSKIIIDTATSQKVKDSKSILDAKETEEAEIDLAKAKATQKEMEDLASKNRTKRRKEMVEAAEENVRKKEAFLGRTKLRGLKEATKRINEAETDAEKIQIMKEFRLLDLINQIDQHRKNAGQELNQNKINQLGRELEALRSHITPNSEISKALVEQHRSEESALKGLGIIMDPYSKTNNLDTPEIKKPKEQLERDRANPELAKRVAATIEATGVRPANTEKELKRSRDELEGMLTTRQRNALEQLREQNKEILSMKKEELQKWRRENEPYSVREMRNFLKTRDQPQPFFRPEMRKNLENYRAVQKIEAAEREAAFAEERERQELKEKRKREKEQQATTSWSTNVMERKKMDQARKPKPSKVTARRGVRKARPNLRSRNEKKWVRRR